jgi:hypothetical protein
MTRSFLTRLSLVLALSLFGSVASAQTTTDWLTSQDYQAYFDSVVPAGYMPVSVQAGLVYGHVRYQATFAPTPAGISWVARHGQSDSSFAETNAGLTSQGYRLSFHHRFNTEGMIRNQAIWVR